MDSRCVKGQVDGRVGGWNSFISEEHVLSWGGGDGRRRRKLMKVLSLQKKTFQGSTLRV